MDVKNKKQYISQNTWLCKFGNLKNLTNYQVAKNTYRESYETDNHLDNGGFCNVYVIKSHCLSIAHDLVAKSNNKIKPAILNIVSEKFENSGIDNLEGVLDDQLHMKTNFTSVAKMNSCHPPKQNEVIYNPFITVVRDESMNINPQNIFIVSVITITSLKEYKVLESEDGPVMTVESYISTKMKIESVFQTAHLGGHGVLILNDFGCTRDSIPIGDLVDIYNSCILKYGHLFQDIIFAFPIKDTKDIASFAYFLKQIIKPQELCQNEEQEEAQLLAEINN